MIRIGLLLAIMWVLPFADPVPERPPKNSGLAKFLLDRVRPRTGVVNGALAVVPLVIVDGEKALDVPPREAVDWQPVGNSGREERVTVERRASDRLILLPGGVLLGGGVRERLLSRPLLLDEKPAVVAARFADRREAPLEKAGSRVAGRVAPLLQRKLDLLLEEAETLRDLLHVQAYYAGLEPEKKRVEDLFGAPGISARVGSLRSAMAGIPRSYGGGTCGYVAFFGGRAVEIVLLASPQAFESLGPGYLHALAVSAAIWEKAIDWAAPPETPEPDDWVTAAKSVIVEVRSSGIRKGKPGAKEKRGGTLYRVRPKASTQKGATKGVYAGRILISPEGWPLQLEVFDYGGSLIFPSPLRKPDGRPVDAKPDVTSGALTRGYLARLAGRRGSIRAALFGR